MRENINISLQILMLNDFLRTNVIDKEIYDKVVQKIEAIEKQPQAA